MLFASCLSSAPGELTPPAVQETAPHKGGLADPMPWLIGGSFFSDSAHIREPQSVSPIFIGCIRCRSFASAVITSSSFSADSVSGRAPGCGDLKLRRVIGRESGEDVDHKFNGPTLHGVVLTPPG
jgi:hypothetical protein